MQRRTTAIGTAVVALLGVVTTTSSVPAVADMAHRGALTATTVKTVTNTNDKGKGSLRAAIFQVNNPSLNFDTIHFRISGAGPHVITPLSPLPTLDTQITIDGYSQPGTAEATDTTSADLDIVISFPRFVPGDGLRLETDDSVIRGLVVNKARGAGISITGDRNTIAGNYVGTYVNGESTAGNKGDGIKVNGDFNTIGGSLVGDRNLISGNEKSGIRLVGGEGDTIQGNRIGTDDDGQSDRGNTTAGITVVDASKLSIGGEQPNLISGNGGPGIDLQAGDSLMVVGNLIGTDADGIDPIGNDTDGILTKVDGTLVTDNVIGYNAADGIDAQADALFAFTNLIGVSGVPPMTAIPNGADGISVVGDGAKIGDADAGNTIAANGGNGVTLDGDVQAVAGNFIGTDPAATPLLGNTGDGVLLIGTLSVIGGDLAEQGNLISGNHRNGVEVIPPTVHQGDDLVANNLIGTELTGTGPLPNDGAGVSIEGSRVQVRENRIAFNGRQGVVVVDGTDNPVTANSIDLNGLLGIDLLPLGRTVNDPGDPDAGPNGLLNYPVVVRAIFDGTNTVVTWEIVDGLPNTPMHLEFFVSDACNSPTGTPASGEGDTLLGSVDMATGPTGDANGVVAFPVASAPGQVVASTATLFPVDAPSPTSEFSPCRTVQ